MPIDNDIAYSSLVFDLDGTLIDSAALVGSILNEMRAENNSPPLDMAFYHHWSSRGGLQLVGHALDIAPEDAQSAVDEFRRRYRDRPTPQDSVYSGVHETLFALQMAGLTLALCSNKPEHLCRNVLSETSLDRYFSALIGGDSTPYAKPSRAPLDAAMQAIGAHPSATLMIGDSTVDQKTAAAVGIGFVLFTGGYDDGVVRHEASAVIDHIPDLLEIVLPSVHGGTRQCSA